MDVPGLKADDLEIELDGHRLTVRGERKPPYGEGDDAPAPARTERPYGAFERTLRLAEEFDADAIEGSIARGVLTLRIPLSNAHVANRVDRGMRRVRTPRAIEPSIASASNSSARRSVRSKAP